MRTRSNALAALLTVGVAQAAAQPAVDPVIAKATAYVVQYETTLGGLVAEEDYTQQRSLRGPVGSPRQTRKLKSDFMLVKFTTDEPWIPFRDVISVDGQPVGDRDARLERLFLQPGSEARQNASRITDEGARYNLGTMRRNVNVPVLGLEYLKPGNAERCLFGKPHQETIDGAAASKIDYTERGGPTVIRDGRNGGNVPAKGTFWIRNVDGAVMRSTLRTTNGVTEFEIDVRYCQVPSIAVLVPCKMSDRYSRRAEQVTGVATYTNIRQFKVITTESIKD
jgi:hypothetical protein